MNQVFSPVTQCGKFKIRSSEHQLRKLILWGLTSFTLIGAGGIQAARAKPNIIYILCDDLGYGDVKCLNTQGKIATPNLDKLAAGGMIFSDMHSSSSVCTPSRYSIMTGRYCWRTRLQNGVLDGLSSHLIEDGRMTVADLLQQHGYATACIGKWHLGMNWPQKNEISTLGNESSEQASEVDFTKLIRHGPNTVGFAYYFGISASLDMAPYTFIENDHVTVQPSENRKLPIMAGRTQEYTRQGPAAPGFTGYEVLPTLTQKVLEYLAQHAIVAKKGKPFFIYMPLNAPHTPILPTAEWLGKSGLNPYGDFVMETDHEIGRVMAELEKQGIADNTLIIVTSDNGCSHLAKFDEFAAKGHNPNYHFRGHKSDIFEGGHRIPFIASWPAQVKPGSSSNQLLCLGDFMATAAQLIGAKLPANAAEDSVSFLPALLGKAPTPLRDSMVQHSFYGSFSIRQANWKLEFTPSSGGWGEPVPRSAKAAKLPPIQLYDLDTDIGEQHNLQAEHPEMVARLTHLLEKLVADGRSTQGPKQPNDVPIDIWKAAN